MILPQVKLVSYTKSVSDSLDQTESSDLRDLIVLCARVSNPANAHNTKTADKLINYLIANQHWSPFEMVSVCVEITTTRDISRQLLRHRSFCFQEYSQRYSNPLEIMAADAFVHRDPRLQDKKNRQSSIKTDDKLLSSEWTRKQDEVISTAKAAYEWAIKNGIAKEQARAVLPEGLTVTKLYMSGTIRSWIHYCSLRSGNGTQLEHAEIAKAIIVIISKIFKGFPVKCDSAEAPNEVNEAAENNTT